MAAYSRKLHKSMYDGGDNGGLTYGVEIMNEHRKGTMAGGHQYGNTQEEGLRASVVEPEP